MSGVRWWLLAEDKNHERLALMVAPRLGLNSQPVKVSVAPAGKGAVSAWVRLQYAQQVRTTVRKRPNERVALLVMVDGDNVGLMGRKRELDTALTAASEPARSANEPIVVWVPTWSVETWLITPPATSESESLKEQLREPTSEHFQQAIDRLLRPAPNELPVSKMPTLNRNDSRDLISSRSLA